MKTSIVNKYKEPFDIYIGRGSKWGNPFTHLPLTDTKAQFWCNNRDECIAKYREWILSQLLLLSQLGELKGKTLGCFCKPLSCHGDVLIELIESGKYC